MQPLQRGFSLIEILVAFSIAAVSLTVIFQIYAKGTTAAILGEEYAQAIAIAESRLAEAGGASGANAQELSGIENEKYNWRIQIDDFIPPEPSDFEEKLRLINVSVEVSWQAREKQRVINLHSLKPVRSP